MKRIYFLLTILSFAVVVMADNETTTRMGSVNIVKEIKPAILDIVPKSIQFVDATGNHAIDASEKSKLIFQVANHGTGDGYGCVARVTATGATAGISVQKSQSLNVIPVNGMQTVEIPITSDMNTANGQIELTFQVDEPNGFGTPPSKITIDTRAFVAPFLQVADHTITGSSGVLQRRVPFDLQVIVQNTQYGLAENVSVDIELPNGVYIMGGTEHTTINQMAAGEAKSLEYTLAARVDYASNTIPVKVNIREKYGKYAKNEVITLQLNQNLDVKKYTVNAKQEERPEEIELYSLTSDVDKNIPTNPTTNTNTFAFIIANENYESLAKVPCAINDGKIFADYCRKTLGLPEDHVHFETDLTFAKMGQFVTLLTDIAQYNPNSHIIFYYAGHGAPNETTKEAFLMPVDAYRVDPMFCYGLDKLYIQFKALANNRVTVFLDACFSGTNRDEQMLASARGVAIAPKANNVQGNLVVFSAASGDQTALPYEKEGHGMFTYFLLKKLQETSGNVTYSELKTYLETKVPQQSLTANRKKQNPTVTTSAALGNDWLNWTLK